MKELEDLKETITDIGAAATVNTNGGVTNSVTAERTEGSSSACPHKSRGYFSDVV